MKPVSIYEINSLWQELHDANSDTFLLKFEYLQGNDAATTLVRVYNTSENSVLNNKIHLGWAINYALQYYLGSLIVQDIPTQEDAEKFNQFYQILHRYFARWNIPHFFIKVALFVDFEPRIFLVEIPQKYLGWHMLDIVKKINKEMYSLRHEREFKVVIRDGFTEAHFTDPMQALEAYGLLMASLMLGTADITKTSTLVDSNGNNLLYRSMTRAEVKSDKSKTDD